MCNLDPQRKNVERPAEPLVYQIQSKAICEYCRKTRISAPITIQKAARSLEENLLGDHVEHPVFPCLTLYLIAVETAGVDNHYSHGCEILLVRLFS
jgi:hypothetical protein